MVLAGDVVKASDIYAPSFISKSATETVTSSSTYQNDDDFIVALGVGTWRVQLFAHVSGAAAADIKVRWNFSGSVSATGRACIGPQSGTTDATVTTMRAAGHGFASDIVYGLDGTNTTIVHEDVFLTVTAPGTLTLQWAQNTGNATGTAMSTSSRMYIDELEPA
jgi:hypothetical protein